MDFVESVCLFQGAKAASQVVDDGAGHKRLRAIGANAGTPVDVMVDRRFLVLGICKVRLLLRISSSPVGPFMAAAGIRKGSS